MESRTGTWLSNWDFQKTPSSLPKSEEDPASYSENNRFREARISTSDEDIDPVWSRSSAVVNVVTSCSSWEQPLSTNFYDKGWWKLPSGPVHSAPKPTNSGLGGQLTGPPHILPAASTLAGELLGWERRWHVYLWKVSHGQTTHLVI